MQAGELKNRIQIYKYGSGRNILGEDDDEPVLYKEIKAKIVPLKGTSVQYPGDTKDIEVTHKLTIRSGLTIAKDMFIMYAGQKYNIEYWQPVYNNERYMEIMVKMEVPND